MISTGWLSLREFGVAWCAALCLVASPAQANRLALVIGNDNYQHVSKLQKAGNDAVAMATELRAAGFEVSLYRDLDYRSMVKATEAMYGKIKGGDEVVVFFAGHGVQIKSGNFLLPTDIEATTESAVEKTSYALHDLTERLETAKAAFSLIMVDACRDNPLKTKGRSVGGERGLTPPDPPIGQMVVYSASRGEQALDRLSDSDANPNSVFTREFIARMRKPGIKVEDLVREIQISVEKLASTVGHKQRPALYNEVRGNFYFFGPTTVVVPPAAPAGSGRMDEAQREDRFWEDTKSAGNRDGFEAYLELYPRGRYASLARANISRLTSGGISSAGPRPTSPIVAPTAPAATATNPSSAALVASPAQSASTPVTERDRAASAAASTDSKPVATVGTPQTASMPSASDTKAVSSVVPPGKTRLKVSIPNGDSYDGEMIGNVRQGVGIYTFANGDIYEGDFVDNTIHGKGTQTSVSGEVYTGDFQRGIKTGQGVLKSANGDRFEGRFLDNQFHGYGTQTFRSGESYEGEFVRGNKHGKGTYRFVNGDRFEGNFVDNLFTGKGVIVFANGDRYDGDILNDVKHGQGVHYFASKDRYEGSFAAGDQSGRGTHFYANGDRFEGEFAKGLRHGKGTYRFANGQTTEMEFVNGIAKP